MLIIYTTSPFKSAICKVTIYPATIQISAENTFQHDVEMMADGCRRQAQSSSHQPQHSSLPRVDQRQHLFLEDILAD